MVNALKYQKELEHFRNQHKAIEAEIAEKVRAKVVNQFEVQALKKKKLEIKEYISGLEALLVGDIVA
jgi:hypothetical protein